MPFDTTYTIYGRNLIEPIKIIVPGEKDTSISYHVDNIPSHLKSHPNVVELIKYEDSFKPKNSEIFLTVAGIVALGFLLGILTGKLKSFFKIENKLKNLNRKSKAAWLFIVFALAVTIFLGFSGYGIWALTIGIFALFSILEFKNELFYPERITNDEVEYPLSTANTINNKPYLLLYGSTLNFTDIEIDKVLSKRFFYYKNLEPDQKSRFIIRVQKFMSGKIFHIHSPEGFKEMPILVSASAIQLTFGLKKYLLPYFQNIHIYPEEFFRANNIGICFLEGNVSGNNINLSWKHFLKGYEVEVDGQNVGLHELAHAQYYQTFIVEQQIDKKFRTLFDDFVEHGDKVHHLEKQSNKTLYSPYADKNFQEFWAESIEIFFEKPIILKTQYPELYNALCFLLNQDPALLQNSALT